MTAPQPADGEREAWPDGRVYACPRLGCTWWVVGSSAITPQEIAEHDRKAHR